MPKFEHIGRNTEIDGRKLEAGEVIDDPRPLDKIFLNKFKNLTATKPKKVKPPVEDDEDDDTPPAESEAATAEPTAKRDETVAAVPDYVDVTDKFPKAGKADLVVFEFKDGNYQLYDSEDKDNSAATPINKSPLRTVKAVNESIDKYKS